jgi:predicted thioesterase
MPRGSSELSPALEHRLAPGLTASVSLTVAEDDTALALGSGDVAVLATPRLITLCEEASCRAVEGRLGSGTTTVASRIRFDHLAPVGVGTAVTAEATLKRVEGRRLVFTVCARLGSDTDAGLVGAGQVTRVLVDKAKFLAKTSGRGAH